MGAGAAELALEVVMEGVVWRLGTDEAVMEPVFDFVVVDRGSAFHAIGDVDIGPAVVFDIERGGAPGPAGSGDGLGPGWGGEGGIGVAEVEAIALGHIGAHGFFEGVFCAPEVEVVESVHCGRGHAEHEEVQLAIGVEVGEGMGHAEGVRVGYELAGLVGERGVAGVEVEVESGEVTHDDEVGEVILVQVDE